MLKPEVIGSSASTYTRAVRMVCEEKGIDYTLTETRLAVRGANGDPAALRDAERQSTTMKELGERFLTQYVPTRCKPSTQAEYRRSVELFLDPFFAKQHVRSVTTADVAELHGSLSHIPYQANRTLGVLSKMMNLAETWGIRHKHSNPCEDVERYPDVSARGSCLRRNCDVLDRH